MKFKSLKFPERAYSFKEKGVDYISIYFKSYAVKIHYDLAQFDCYDDGMIQHSPLYSVGKEQTLDFLVSFADYLVVQEEIPSVKLTYAGASKADVDFILSLKYNEEKTIYYNLAEKKKSSADSKRYDKRWEVVPSWVKGDFETVFRILNKNHYYDVIDLLQLGMDISEHMYGYNTQIMFDYIQVSSDIIHAYQRVSNLLDSANAFKRYKENLISSLPSMKASL